MATSFGHNGHHQAISQELKKAGIPYKLTILQYMGQLFKFL